MDKHFTIIIPSYREAANLRELVERIAKVNFGDRQFEVLLIDDNSNDGIIDAVHTLSHDYPWLNILIRDGKRDLSQSVIKGFENARYPILITMDADLSHPPEKIPLLLEMLDQPNVDIVIGSRYIPGGSVDKKWPFLRKLSSRMAALLARAVLPQSIKDPLSGFLAVRKSTFEAGDPLEPIGWKIGLELMVKCRCKNVREIPIHFSLRRRGKSKLNFRISMAYFCHVGAIMKYKAGLLR
jgi:dolichol-phosphate mannosyltransferase